MTVNIRTQANADWTATGDWTNDPTHVTAWLGGHFVAESNAIAGLEVLENNDTYRIPAGTLIPFNITPANGALGDADQAIEGLIDRAADEVALQFRLHSADPGAAHTANELQVANEPGYARQSVSYEATRT